MRRSFCGASAASMMARSSPCSERWLRVARSRSARTCASGTPLIDRSLMSSSNTEQLKSITEAKSQLVFFAFVLSNILILLGIMRYVLYMFLSMRTTPPAHLQRWRTGEVRPIERANFLKRRERRVEKLKTSQCGPAERRHQNRVTKEEIIGGAWISRRETVGRRAGRDRSYSIAGMTRSGGL